MPRLAYSWLSITLPVTVRNSPSTTRPISSRRLSIRATNPMEENKKGEEQLYTEDRITNTVKFKPEVNKMQQLLRTDPSGGWERCWEQGVIPWDLGRPTPVIVHLHQTGALPKGRTLVPACGTGYDVVAIACPERYVVGLEISDTAITKAAELFSSSPNANYFTFLKADFFIWQPTEQFDLIIDYTFFCAIEPEMRSEWAHRMRDLLKPDGELITLIFPIDDHVGGPPYKASVSDYEEVLHPMGFEAVFIADNELAIEARKGREKLGRWKRSLRRSVL